MNAVNEIINFEEITKSCRQFDPRETIAQMKHMNAYKFMCWGATRFTVDNTMAPKMLRFYVRGMKHKGHVYVFLNGMDLYDVYICSSKGRIKEIGEGLYFDQLTDWIDNRIEKTSAHAW